MYECVCESCVLIGDMVASNVMFVVGLFSGGGALQQLLVGAVVVAGGGALQQLLVGAVVVVVAVSSAIPFAKAAAITVFIGMQSIGLSSL